MGRRGGGGGGRGPVKGFRPGKEPPQLRRQQARQQFGELNAAQERLVELLSSRTPAEGRALMRRWRTGLLAGGGLLAVVGAVLWAWSAVAGVVVHLVAFLALVVWWQLHRQREGFDAMADAVGGGRGGASRGRSSRR